jgi:hypothetical protein
MSFGQQSQLQRCIPVTGTAVPLTPLIRLCKLYNDVNDTLYPGTYCRIQEALADIQRVIKKHTWAIFTTLYSLYITFTKNMGFI